MARSTLTQRVETIDEQLDELEDLFENQRLVAEFRLSELARQLIERVRIDEQLQNKIVELSSRLATTEEKCRMLEKLSDRGWQGWLALIGAGLALLVAFLKR